MPGSYARPLVVTTPHLFSLPLTPLPTMPILSHDRVTADGADPTRFMFMAHGIYGSGRNWTSVARRFVRARREWGVYLIDLRMHGESQGFSEPHTIQACADDLDALAEHLDLSPDAILGHSFGGKVALLFAAQSAPDHVWVVDSPPGVRPPSGSAWEMLAMLRKHPGPFADRDAGIAAIQSAGFVRPVAQWMATNLAPRPDGSLEWRLDVDALEALARDFFQTDAWPIIEAPPADTHIHVVKAEESGAIDESDCARIEEAGTANGRVSLHRVPGGHWVNADAPDALHDLLMEMGV